MEVVLALLYVLVGLQTIHAFRPLPLSRGKFVRVERSSMVQVSGVLDHVSSQIVAAGADYASEIENAVGEEIYGPIFKAGIFLFASGIVAAFGVAFIVSKSDSWNDLEVEFDEGKKKQLIVSDSDTDMAAAAPQAASSEPVKSETTADAEAEESDIDDLDL